MLTPMLTRDTLCNHSCQPQHGSACTSEQVIQQLQALPDWQCLDNTLCRNYHFKNYYETMAFVNALVFMVHRQDHHPELRVHYNICEVRYNTHSVNGITLNDFICAAKTDAIFGTTTFETE